MSSVTTLLFAVVAGAAHAAAEQPGESAHTIFMGHRRHDVSPSGQQEPSAPRTAAPADSDTHQLARGLYTMMPAAHADTDPEQSIERIEAELRSTTFAQEPTWASHSHAERTAQLRLNLGQRGKQYRAERRAAHRRMQGKWGGSSAAAKDASVIELLQPSASVNCDDALATNRGQPAPCAYDCQDLKREYFPDEESRCFLFDPASGTWPESGGQGAELLSMRQQRLETETFVSLTDGTNPPADGVSFTVGAGRECREVEIASTFMGSGETHTETLCLVDGEHEYNHTITEQHSVEVVGFAESGVHDGAGGTTSFVVGECTDALLRVTTTAAGGPLAWNLDDGGHNGPWTFETSGSVGVEEIESCMFDNEFTLVRQGRAGWEGAVEVIGFVRYHNTVEIPNDESWIVQGTVEPTTGLQASLNARLSSGTALAPSHANIVLRGIRFTGQVAPIDPHSMWGFTTTALLTPVMRYGGAFRYFGGTSTAPWARIIFEQLIFDHNRADSAAGAVLIHGRGGHPVPNDPSRQNWDSGISWTMTACTFYRNFARFGGAVFAADIWPGEVVVDRVDYVHNEAFGWTDDWFSLEEYPGPERRAGVLTTLHTDEHHDGGFRSEGLVNNVMYASGCLTSVAAEEPNRRWEIVYDRTAWVDHGASYWPPALLILDKFPPLALPQTMSVRMVETSISGNRGLSPGIKDASIFLHITDIDEGVLERCRFEDNGIDDSTSTGAGGLHLHSAQSALPTPTFRVIDSEFVGNTAGSGPAFALYAGLSDVAFQRCLFQANVGYVLGGAISFDGAPSSTLLIERSIFEGNGVEPPQSDEKDAAATVVTYTGQLGEGSQSPSGEYHVPLWRIDDGPVYGAPWDLCQRALQYAREVAMKGFPTPWPSDLECANVTYRTDTTYSKVEYLASGDHTLHHGVMSMTSQGADSWRKGWIQVVGVVEPVFPIVVDDRMQVWDCAGNHGNCDPVARPDYCCPWSAPFWSSTPFSVTKGKGGAVATSGRVLITVIDSVFRSNEAPQGATLATASARSVVIANTSIDRPASPSTAVATFGGAEVATCVENPCEVGNRCTFRDHSTFCDPCADNEIGTDGISCSACRPGTQPDSQKIQCEDCGQGSYSQIGLCIPCPAGETSSGDRTGCVPCGPGTYRADEPECTQCPAGNHPNEQKTTCESCISAGPSAYSPDGRECRDCPARNAPNYERTACFCQADTYNAKELGLVICRGASFHSDGVDTDECAVCPACMDCSIVGQTALKSGWAFFGTAGEAYPCPGAGKFEACPPLVLDENATMDSSTCALGYEGPVCGNCESEYNHLKVGNPCDPCDDGVINVPLVMGLFAGALAVGGAVISGALGVLQDFGVITDLRILVGFYQILGQAGNVLDLIFPYPVPELVDFIKLLFLDVRKIVMLDCWNIGGFYGKIVTNIVAVPAFIVGVCVLIYISQKRTLMAVIEAGAADTSGLEVLTVKLKQNLFLGIFLVYPTITTTLFRVPQCEYFGDSGFHEDDYTIDCGTTKFQATVAFAVFIIILIPIGVPAIFMILMLRAKKSLGGAVNETALGGAKLVPDDADDEADSYGFLIRDYRPQYWYHEIVTYSRKLLLGGISVVMGRGTMAQTYFVISTEAFYLMHHMRTYPFVNYKHNVIEALGHCALMLLYAISLILRNEDDDAWDAEWFPKTGYGWFIVFIFAIVLPSPTVYFYRKDAGAKASGSELGEGFEENPLAIEMDQSATDEGDGGGEPTAAQPARAKLAKMQREAKDARAQVQKLQIENQQNKVENQQKQDEIQQLQSEVQQLHDEIEQLEAQGQMDGDAVRQSESALRKENAALKSQLASASQRQGMELVAVSGGEQQLTDQTAPPGPTPDLTPAKTKEAALKELAGDESLSEEARDTAMKALEAIVASQLVEIEQEAAVKQLESEQNAALKKLESEALFIDQQARIEALAEAKKVEVESLAVVKKLEAEAQSKRDEAGAKTLLHAPDGLCDDMMGWLGQHRLQQCAADMARIAGACAATSFQCECWILPHWCSACRTVLPSDLQYLTEENVEEIGAALTHVERMRLQAALQALRGAPASLLALSCASLCSSLPGPRNVGMLVCAEDIQAVAATE
eukprot:COSAG04_NODE_148_length_22826_cov_11.360026_4_plen_2104_part_00